jgi:hypothetical protein
MRAFFALFTLLCACHPPVEPSPYAPPDGFVTDERIAYTDGLHNENTQMLALDDRILLVFRGGETAQIGSDKGLTWTDPVKTAADVDDTGKETYWGFWRITERSDGTPYALAYDDGDTAVAMFQSADGLAWTKTSVVVDSYDDVPSEAELQFFGDGDTTAVALVRMDNQGILQDGQTAICTSLTDGLPTSLVSSTCRRRCSRYSPTRCSPCTI